MTRPHPAGPRHGDVAASAGLPPLPSDASALDRQVWPDSARRTLAGDISIAGVSVTDLVAEYGSPLFVFDEEHVRSRARAFLAAFDTLEVPADVYYASKAFLTTSVARWLTEEGLGLDAASLGELEVALLAGTDPTRIVLHGNNKSDAELRRAMQAGVARIVIDSLDEVSRVDAIANECGIVQGVLIRVTVGVEAHTHEFIATAHEDQKFGLSVASGAALDAVEQVLAAPNLALLGLHSHIGSQIFDASGFEVAAHRVIELAAQVRDRFGITIAELDLGGGMGIAYTSADDPLDIAHMGKAIHDILIAECARVGLPLPRLGIEPGRAIVGGAAVTVYEVGTVKPVALDSGGERTYVSVDGGMSDNIRTALYDAEYTVTLANRAPTASAKLARVVGKHCESGDIVVRDAWLPEDLARGDLLAVAATGAYCRAMASNYNYLPRPAVVSVRNGQVTVLLRRESLADLLALDPGASRG